MSGIPPQNKWSSIGFISAGVFLAASSFKFFTILILTLDLFDPPWRSFYFLQINGIVSMASAIASIVILSIIHKPSKLVCAFVWVSIITLIIGFVTGSGSIIFFDFLYEPSKHSGVTVFSFSGFWFSGFEPTALCNSLYFIWTIGTFAMPLLLFSFYRRSSPPYKMPLLILVILYSVGLLMSHFTPVMSWLGFQLTGRGIQLGDTFHSLALFFAYGSGLWVLFVELPLLSFPVAVVVMARAEKKKRKIEG